MLTEWNFLANCRLTMYTCNRENATVTADFQIRTLKALRKRMFVHLKMIFLSYKLLLPIFFSLLRETLSF